MRLIDGQTGLHLWAESFERPSSDLMSVRDTFIRESVQRLQSWLVPVACGWSASRPTGRPEEMDVGEILVRPARREL